ncbi:eukaryotic translation initiation factor 5B-like [Forsythia ovata]|uniref:Eukaryotic translation initiation factor 5B-like n=1 Tax=Forsythia ovata TaxID=205694 RepID=A0ABD1VD51_9LAMI
MEEPKKPCLDQEKSKMVIKLGGGGIGAVVLLAGALATTAVASAFIVGRKRGNNQHHHLTPPPTVSHESLNKKEKDGDEATKGNQFVLPDSSPLGHNNLSIGATNMAEAENDTTLFVSTENMISDEKTKLINGEKGSAAYSVEETFCSNCPKKLESSAISVDRFYVPILDEKVLFKPESTKNNGHVPAENLKVTEEDDAIHKNIADNNQDKTVNVEEKQAEGDPVDDEEISAIKCEVAVETIDADQTAGELQLSEEKTDICCDQEEGDGVHTNEGKYNQQIQVNIEENKVGGHCDGEIAKVDKTAGEIELEEERTNICGTQEPITTDFSETECIASENYGEDGQKFLQPAVGNLLVIEHGTTNDDKIEGLLPIGTNENVLESNLQVELNTAEEIPCNKDEETVCIDNTMPANSQSRDYDEHEKTLSEQMLNGSSPFVSEIVIDDPPKEELLIAVEIAALKEEAANGEDDGNQDVKEDNPLVQLLDFQQKEYENGSVENAGEEIEVASETIGGEDEEKVDDIEDETNDMAEEDFADKLDENLEGTGDFSAESNEEALRTAELLQGSLMKLQGVNLDYQEMEGKIEEDKAAREGKYNLLETIEGDTAAKAVEYNILQSTENSSIDKYMMKLGTQYKPTKKIILIGTVSVLSWISCSWFFGLSFVKLCLIVFFTMVLSKIQGY